MTGLKIRISPDFFEPLPEDELREWGKQASP